MNKIRRVEQILLDRIQSDGCIHLSLIDPEKTKPKDAASIAVSLERYGTTAIMVGGSTVASNSIVDKVVQEIKKSVKVPVILFPNNITGISHYADAMWFMSLLNSTNPLFITGLQALAAPVVKTTNMEAISLAYIIIGEASTAAYIGQAHIIPYDAIKIATSYALAAEYLGMHFIYLEAGSGARQPISSKMVSMVKKNTTIPIIVGGGLRDTASIASTVRAGADAIVTGTVIEDNKSSQKVKEIIDKIKNIKNLD